MPIRWDGGPLLPSAGVPGLVTGWGIQTPEIMRGVPNPWWPMGGGVRPNSPGGLPSAPSRHVRSRKEVFPIFGGWKLHFPASRALRRVACTPHAIAECRAGKPAGAGLDEDALGVPH
ncbi:hypothetical protein NDU88_002518 [Pleurodeles waltl]|uniref:Uncharacterized protein n=1 Tax=Pleurodeles waltl TaxID=8319 RepID=A0AAV7T2M6_PLEWA|nr:hypothetical protein NDU88_002518 [Pleurodeles waltl]